MPTNEELQAYYAGLANPAPTSTPYNNLAAIANIDLSLTNSKQQRLNDRTAQKQAKMQTAAELQQGLSDAVDAQVYTRDDGTQYTIDYQPAVDKFGEATVNPVEIPYNGETRNLYIDNTVDGNYKLGLAAVSFDARYNPNSADAKRITNSNAWKNAKYHQSDVGHYGVTQDMVGTPRNINPDGSIKPYGWKPGPKGVTPEDGSLLDITLPYDKATQFEYGVHSNIGQIRNRAIGTGPISQQDINNFGSGKTEYTTPNAPMWNINYKDPGTSLPEGTPLPKPIKSNHTRQSADYYLQQLNAMDDNNHQGFFDSLMNVPKAAAAGVARSVYDIADTGVEAVGSLAGRAVSVYDEDTGKFLDTADLATDKEKSKQINSGLGYNDTYLRQKMDSANKHYDKAVKEVDLFKPTTWGKIDASELWASFKDAFSTPEAAGYSMGYLVPALVGVWEKGAIRLMSKVGQKSAMDVAKIAKDTTLSKASKKTAISDITKNLSLRDKTKLVIADHIDATVYGGAMTNDQLDEVIANNGGEVPTLWDVGWRVALNAAGMKLDMASARAITMGPSPADALADKLKSMGKTKATKVMAAMTSYAAKLGAAGLTEMPQEYTQSFIEAFSRAYGTDVATDFNGGTRRIGAKEALLSPKTRTQAAQGAIQGGPSGVHMALPHVGIEALSDATGGNLKEGLDKKIDDLKSVADAPTEDVEAQPDSLAGQMKDLNLEDAKTLFDSAKAELDQGGKDNGISAVDYFRNLPDSQQRDFHEANRIYKQKVADEAVATGNTDSLGATSDMENAIIAAYASADESNLPKFEQSMEERTVEGSPNFDKDISQIMEKAKEARKVYQELNGLDKTRKGVVLEGLDDNKKGFTQYFKNAISSPVGSDTRKENTDKLLQFTKLQEDKKERLDNGRQAVINEIADKVDKLWKKAHNVDSEITKDLIWQAMVRASSDNRASLVGRDVYRSSLGKVTKAGISKNDLDTTGKFTPIDYGSKKYNRMNKGYEGRKPGTFEVNHKGALVDYAKANNISLEVITNKFRTGSVINEASNAVGREIEAMYKALQLIDKSNKRKSSAKTSPEVSMKPQESQTNQEGTTSPEEPKKPSKSSEKSSDNHILETYIKEGLADGQAEMPRSVARAKAINISKEYDGKVAEVYTKAYAEGIKASKVKAKKKKPKKPKSKPTVDETSSTQTKSGLNKAKVEEDIISIYKLLPPGIQAQIRKKLKGTKGSHATTTIQTKLEDC